MRAARHEDRTARRYSGYGEYGSPRARAGPGGTLADGSAVSLRRPCQSLPTAQRRPESRFFVFEGAVGMGSGGEWAAAGGCWWFGASGSCAVVRRGAGSYVGARGRTSGRAVVPFCAVSYLMTRGRTLEGLQRTTARFRVRRREKRYDHALPGTTARVALATARRRTNNPMPSRPARAARGSADPDRFGKAPRALQQAPGPRNRFGHPGTGTARAGRTARPRASPGDHRRAQALAPEPPAVIPTIDLGEKAPLNRIRPAHHI